MSRPLRVVVCGTIFGQVYLEAFRRPDPRLELAGVLGRGSERSRQCAETFGVPLFTSVDQLPDDVEAACVVIRSGLLGGRGVELATRLMERGISVIQEHPLHHDELAACLRVARRQRVVYELNSFYPNLAPVRRFLGATAALVKKQRLLYIDMACGFQVAYALLDIVGRALGGSLRRFSIAGVSAASAPAAGDVASQPYRVLQGSISNVPFTLRIQNQLDPSDPDNYAHLMHRITLGTEGGNLTLVNTHGPLYWSPRPHFPREVRDQDGDLHFDGGTTLGDLPRCHGGVPSAAPIGPPDAPSFADVFAELWPEGVRNALLDLREGIRTGRDPLRRGQYHLTLCRLWNDITERLGPPELVHAGGDPSFLSQADLAEIRAAASAAEVPPDAAADAA